MLLRDEPAYDRQQVGRPFVQRRHDGKLESLGKFLPVIGELLAGAVFAVQCDGQGLCAVHPDQFDFASTDQLEELVETLGQFVEWVPVCPEVEAGFG